MCGCVSVHVCTRWVNLSTHWSEAWLSTLAHLAAEMTRHFQHQNLNPEVHGHRFLHPHWHLTASPVSGAPFSMNLHTTLPTQDPGSPTALGQKCCRMPVRDPLLARSARALGQLGIRRAGCRALGRPRPAPSWTHEVGSPLLSASTSQLPCPPGLRLLRPTDHLWACQLPPLLGALATDLRQMVMELRGKLRVLREHSESALWGHDPGRTTPPIRDPSKVPLYPWTRAVSLAGLAQALSRSPAPRVRCSFTSPKSMVSPGGSPEARVRTRARCWLWAPEETLPRAGTEPLGTKAPGSPRPGRPVAPTPLPL